MGKVELKLPPPSKRGIESPERRLTQKPLPDPLQVFWLLPTDLNQAPGSGPDPSQSPKLDPGPGLGRSKPQKPKFQTHQTFQGLAWAQTRSSCCLWQICLWLPASGPIAAMQLHYEGFDTFGHDSAPFGVEACCRENGGRSLGLDSGS